MVVTCGVLLKMTSLDMLGTTRAKFKSPPPKILANLVTEIGNLQNLPYNCDNMSAHAFDVEYGSAGNNELSTGLSIVRADVIPTGTPKIYGEELGINFDDVGPNNPGLADQTINIMSDLDKTINLEGDNLNRYINIFSQINC